MMVSTRSDDSQELLSDHSLEDLHTSMDYTSLCLEDESPIDSDETSTKEGSFLDIARRKLGTRCANSGEAGVKPVTLTWEHITLVSPERTTRNCFRSKTIIPAKTILKNVTGIARPGSVTAIMGSSGSGKTLLLNVIAKRDLGDVKVAGCVRVNGHVTCSEIMNITAYSQQQDVFVGTMKVNEHLWFHAQLRLPNALTRQELKTRVDNVLKELGLSHRADTMIGIPGKLKTLSGGERRRLSFASELLTNPSLMLCDEPTTGLDSFMAQSIIESLRSLAASGRTVLCTIHQPSSEIFTMFDQLLLLAGGRTAYHGPVQEASKFFSRCGLPCPMNYNPADFFIQTLSLLPGQEKQHKEVIEKMCTLYEQSELLEDVHLDIDRIQFEADEGYRAITLSEKRRSMASWKIQFMVLMRRCTLNLLRDTGAIRATVIQFIVMGLFLDAIYWRQDYNQNSVQNFNGALYGVTSQVAFCTMAAVYTIIPTETTVFRREVQNGMYSVLMYFVTHVLTDIPIFIVIILVFSAITYWPIGFYPAMANFVVYTLSLMLLGMYGISFGHLIAIISPNFNGGLALLTLTRNIMSLFGGVFISVSSLPVLVLPIAYLTAFLYSMELLSINQWADLSYLECSTNTTGISRCLHNGQQVLAVMGFSPAHEGIDWAAIIVLYSLTELLAYFLLHRKAKKF